MGRLSGKRIVLTGAAGTLGAAIARECVREGAAALLLADQHVSTAEALARDLSGSDTKALATFTDVGNRSSVDEMIELALSEFGKIDVLINNAGILTAPARVHNVTEDDFRAIIDVNLLGVFNGMHAVVPPMRANGGGTIINTASVAGLTAWSHAGPYCATKAAVIQLSKVAAVEYAAENIRVNAVCPGTFHTSIHDNLSSDALREIAKRHPVGRLATPEEVASAFIYLASDESSFVTGTALIVDGGYSAP